MSWHYLSGGSIAGCGGGSPCEQVMNSRWSAVGGIIPVSGLATGVYFAMLVAGLFIGPASDPQIKRAAWSFILVIAGSVAGSAIWFTVIQKWIIGEFCPYCLATHFTGILLAVLILWKALNNSGDHSFRLPEVFGRFFIGLIIAGLLVTAQVSINPVPINSNGNSQEDLPVMDYSNVPLLGSPDAPGVVILLFDYECSHCQRIHFMLDEAIRQSDGKLAFALCPAPLNTTCNPYIPRDVDAFKNSCELARIGLTVWLADREAFPEFDNWMFTFEKGDAWHPRSPESAREKAIELVGKEKFSEASNNDFIGRYLQTCTHIYGQTIQNGKGGIPKMIFGSRWIIPEPRNADDLIMILQKNLAVPVF